MARRRTRKRTPAGTRTRRRARSTARLGRNARGQFTRLTRRRR